MLHKMKQFRVCWNGAMRDLCIPQANIDAEVTMTDLPPIADPWQTIVAAMENPIGTAPIGDMLKPRSKVVLLTGDRFTDEMLGQRGSFGHKFLDYFNRLGVRDEDVTLIYAPGSHPTPHWRARLGDDLLQRVAAVCHDCWDERNLSYLGVTSRLTPLWINKTVAEADFRLGFGEISPNVHGGWCGGGKIILPGVAGWDCIEHNHFGTISPTNTLGLADGNHMRLDMEEAARMAHLEMKVDVLVDRKARIVDVFAGDFVAEHRAALNGGARDIWMTKMEPADIYVLYPGEHSEKSLSGSFFIRIEGAELGTKEDGIIILALSAADGWARPSQGHGREMSSDETAELFKAGTEEIARQMVRRSVNVRTASMLYTARRTLERRKVILVCDGISPEQGRAFGFVHCTPDFDEAMAMALADRGADARIATNINADAITDPPGRPVSWRQMPWREG